MKTLSVCLCAAWSAQSFYHTSIFLQKKTKTLDICGMHWDQGFYCCQATFDVVFKEPFYWKWSMCWYLKKEKKPGSKMQSFFSLCKQRGSVCCKGRSLVDEQHGVSSTANSPMGLVFLLLQCRREWNSGLDIDWMGPECSLQPLICYLEALWRREETVMKQYPKTLTGTKCNFRYS